MNDKLKREEEFLSRAVREFFSDWGYFTFCSSNIQLIQSFIKDLEHFDKFYIAFFMYDCRTKEKVDSIINIIFRPSLFETYSIFYYDGNEEQISVCLN